MDAGLLLVLSDARPHEARVCRQVLGQTYINLNKLTCNVVVGPDHRLHHKVTMTTRLTSDRLQHSWICHMSLAHLCTYCKNKQFDPEHIKYF